MRAAYNNWVTGGQPKNKASLSSAKKLQRTLFDPQLEKKLIKVRTNLGNNFLTQNIKV